VKKIWILHPFLFTLFPITSMLAENISQVAVQDALRIAAISVLIVFLSLVIIKRIVGNWEKAALICSGAVLIFFSYGHISSLLKNWTLGSSLFDRHLFLFPLSIFIMLLWAWLILKVVRMFDNLSRFANLVSVGTLVLPVISLINYALQSTTDLSLSGFQYIEYEQARLPSDTEFPDIYYIILDGYAREDILIDLFDYDNSDFLGFLEQNGFYVAKESKSNYSQTDLSLASSLNMVYLDFIVDSRGKGAINRLPLAELIENSQVISFLRSYGYQVITFNSGYGPTVIDSADEVWDSLTDDKFHAEDSVIGSTLNPFENLLLRSTVMILLTDTSIVEKGQGLNPPEDPLFTNHRLRILYILSKLQEVPVMKGSNFVFAHIIAPHPPFVFGSRGEWLTPPGSYTLATEGDRFTGTTEEYILGYRDQLTHLNNLLIETLSSILGQSSPQPVIILQADHGPGASLDEDSYESSNLKERASILNGFYFPDQDSTDLYPSISLVNTFRLVFNRVFKTDVKLLEDKSFFSTLGQPFDFYQIPKEIDNLTDN
jgi:hypothetical protein